MRMSIFIRALVSGAVAIATMACIAPERTTGPDVTISAARATPTSGPTVTSTSPSSSVRNVTLNVRILGSGFDAVSTAKWAIKGVPSSKIVTNSTTYVSPRELVANITIAADADVSFYDVIVTAGSSGKPGIGTESFEVLIEQTDLGTLGGNDAEATSINDAGQIVGGSVNKSSINKPFLWENGVMRDLGLPAGASWARAEGINNTAAVVGSAVVGGKFKPWMWTSSGGMSLLPLPVGVVTGYAMDVNDAGAIAGSVGEIAASHAVIWNSGTMTDIHPSPGGASEAWSINSNGDVLGAYHPAGTDPNDDGVPFVRLATGETRWLPCPGVRCRGGGLNRSGVVAGTVHLSDGSKFAYRWSDYGSGPNGYIGGNGTAGYGISDGGYITGIFRFSIRALDGASLWPNNGQMVPLQSESNSVRSSGSAFDLNSNGWVVGFADKNIGGKYVHRAVRWRYPLI